MKGQTIMSATEKDFESVSSTEFQKAYGRYFDESLKNPVLITTHKRVTHALISIDEFREYKKLKDGAKLAIHISELSDDDFQSIMDAEILDEHDPEK